MKKDGFLRFFLAEQTDAHAEKRVDMVWIDSEHFLKEAHGLGVSLCKQGVETLGVKFLNLGTSLLLALLAETAEEPSNITKQVDDENNPSPDGERNEKER